MNNQSLNNWQPLTIKPPENECLLLARKDFDSFVFSPSNQIRMWFEDNSYEPYAIPCLFYREKKKITRRKQYMKYFSIMFLMLICASCDECSSSGSSHVFGISTVTHDKHKFVIYRTMKGCSLIHHPDCCKGKDK